MRINALALTDSYHRVLHTKLIIRGSYVKTFNAFNSAQVQKHGRIQCDTELLQSNSSRNREHAISSRETRRAHTIGSHAKCHYQRVSLSRESAEITLEEVCSPVSDMVSLSHSSLKRTLSIITDNNRQLALCWNKSDGPKEVKASVSSDDVKEGDTVTLSCTSRGRPDATISWFKQGEEKSKSQLAEWRLVNVKQEDSGQYYCKAENMHGKVESDKISINVKYGPKEVSVTPAVNINDLREGDELKLKCLVGNSNPAAKWFYWYLNNFPLWQQTSETLTISRVKPEHKGFYQCEANNGIKTAQSIRLQVSVKYSPRQIKIEGETLVKVGSNLYLKCSADANPPPSSYTWKHKPAVISETSPLTSPITSSVLNIQKVTIQHSGTYTCDVTNAIGTKAESIDVVVRYPPSTPELIMKSEVREYDVISIICKVQSFPESELTVTGPTDLKNIHTSRLNSTESENMLKIYLNIIESDAGVYRCTAKNTEGTKYTEKQLQVLHEPKNVYVRSDGEQTIGHKLTLTCNSRSNPTSSSYEWKKLINGELKTIGKSQELHFHYLNISDSGQYIRVAGNSIGKQESPPVYIKGKCKKSVYFCNVFFTLCQYCNPLAI